MSTTRPWHLVCLFLSPDSCLTVPLGRIPKAYAHYLNNLFHRLGQPSSLSRFPHPITTSSIARGLLLLVFVVLYFAKTGGTVCPHSITFVVSPLRLPP